MTLKRIGAVVAAIALIVGAMLLRDTLNDDSDDASPGTNPSGNALRVTCSTEFSTICKELGSDYEVTIEPAGRTLDDLANATPDELPDAWLTLDPFPGMLDEIRVRANSLPASVRSAELIGVTDAVLSIPADREPVFTSACGDDPAGGCVGQFAGNLWSDLAVNGAEISGRVKPAINDPAVDAIGLVAFANLLAGYFDNTSFDANAATSDPSFTAWLRNVTNNVEVIDSSSTPLTTMLVRISLVDVAVTTAAEVATTPNATSSEFPTVALAPAFPVAAVLATMGNESDALVSTLTEALIDASWTPPTADAGTLPASTFNALRELWRNNT